MQRTLAWRRRTKAYSWRRSPLARAWVKLTFMTPRCTFSHLLIDIRLRQLNHTHDKTTSGIRARLRAQHYLHVISVLKERIMSNSTMQNMCERLIVHEKGHASLHRWWQQQASGTSFTPSRAVAFWHSKIEGGEDPATAKDFIPDICVTGLMSAMRCFERVELLAYQASVRQ